MEDIFSVELTTDKSVHCKVSGRQGTGERIRSKGEGLWPSGSVT